MKEEFVQFLLRRIEKKLGDVTEAVGQEELDTYVGDIFSYIDQLKHLLVEFIHLTI